MVRSLLSLLLASAACAFTPLQYITFCRTLLLAKGSDAEFAEKRAFPTGTLIEFEEKKRNHVGKILSVTYKSNGSARYEVEEYPSHKLFSIADKEVTYSIPAPNTDKLAEKLLLEFEHAQGISELDIRQEIDISPELLEMAWEETARDGQASELTPGELVELIHSHLASHIENYMAWRLLRADIGHVFFKDIKDHGRVVSFKAKPVKSVEAAKYTFCSIRDDEQGFCFVSVEEGSLRP